MSRIHKHPKLDLAIGWIKDRRERNLPDNYKIAIKEGVSHTAYFAAKRVLNGKRPWTTSKHNSGEPLLNPKLNKGPKEPKIRKHTERQEYLAMIRSFERAGIVELHYENGRLEVSHVAKTVVEIKQ